MNSIAWMRCLYICAPYPRFREAEKLGLELHARGARTVSTWHSHNINDEDEGTALTTPEAISKRYALHDLADLDKADSIVALTEPPGSKFSRGGRHVELGYALGKGKYVFIVGPAENVFCCLPQVTRFDTVDQFIEYFDLGNWPEYPQQLLAQPAAQVETAPDPDAPFEPSVPKTPCESCEQLLPVQHHEGLRFKCTKSGAVVSHLPELLQNCPLHQQQEVVNG